MRGWQDRGSVGRVDGTKLRPCSAFAKCEPNANIRCRLSQRNWRGESHLSTVVDLCDTPSSAWGLLQQRHERGLTRQTDMRWPLRNQIMGPLLAVAIASLVAVAAINARLAANDTRQRIERQLQGVVGVLTTSNFPLTEPVLRKMRDLSSAEFALTDAGGRSLATSFAAAPPQLPNDATVGKLEEVALGPSLALAGQEYFHTAVRLASRPGVEEGRGRVLHVLFPKDEYLRNWRAAFVPPLVVGVVAVAAAAVVARVLAGRISRAMSCLGDEVLRLARGDFGPVELPATDDEIRDLASAVNRTAQMLADYEREVRRTEQMRTVARLGASLAHEMRNAATGCRMAVDLHADVCPGGHDDESLAVARRQLKLMETQLQRFLQIGRRPAEVVRREVDLARLVDDLLPLVRPAANHAKVELVWRLADDDLMIHGDKDGLGQVALNLILNAIEAVQQHPGDTAATRRVTVELRRSEHDDAELVISDTGPGAGLGRSSDTGPSIFEPFVTSKAEGAGLGLAVAKQVIEAHDGAISWSRLDGVTRFRVTLPAATKGAACV
jgi:signal transduction histidine kinase